MSDYIPVAPSLRKRFYEPVILLDALREVYRIDEKLSEPDLESGSGKSLKDTYFCFLNKLSQICDSQAQQPLGKTVSAIAVLDSGTIEYRLASNQRDAQELDTAREYLSSILSVLGRVTDDEVDNKAFMAPIFSGMLQRVLAFNRPRVEGYLQALLENDRLEFCINSSNSDGTQGGMSAAASLRRLQPHVEAARNAPPGNDNEFASHAEALLHAIKTDYKSCLEVYLKKKSHGNNTIADSPWSEARHAIGRLLSYFIAIKVLISARKLWPRLFVDFQVTAIPSSTPFEDPPVVRRNAKGIINRMGRNQTTLDAYQNHAISLQARGLDERIRNRVHPLRFRPIVHAEVNLLASVLQSRDQAAADGEDPLRFFNEAEFGRYIGSSKPTCLLCRSYFNAHPSGVQCRDSHGNLYYNWRAPDVVVGDREADLQRQEILERMVKEVRTETGRAIQERSYTRKKHDSRDTPTNPLLDTMAGSTKVGYTLTGSALAGSTLLGSAMRNEDEELAARMGQVNLDAASMRGWGEDLVSRRGQISLDLASMRGWSDETRETTPESPTEDAQMGAEQLEGKKVEGEKAELTKLEGKKMEGEKVMGEKVVGEKVVNGKVVDEKVVDEKVADEKVVDEKVVAEKLVDEKVVDGPRLDEQDLDEDDDDEGGAKLV